MSELKDKRGRVVAQLNPDDAPYTFTQVVYKTWGAVEKEYVLNFDLVTNLKTGEKDRTKVKGVRLTAK